MLLGLENAIVSLLQNELPSLFSGPGAATASFSADAWAFDRLSTAPVAGELGPEDAVDELPFDSSAPTGPYSLTRQPYPGLKRVYLRSTKGELVALRNAEVVWNPADPGSFAIVPVAGRTLSEFDHLHVMYSAVAEATRLKTLHKLTLQIAGADSDSTERAFALSLSVLAMNHDMLLRRAAFSWAADDYQVDGSVKTLRFFSGSSSGENLRTLSLEAELDLRLERLLAGSEARLAAHTPSPRTAG
ncbi:hypothetical protein [Accumulibacter sp.]|uniref:hypothetical protein n=1 Tax=Accumulibacter sp. TaxID=2053492 RepID=UPI0028C384F4|nr:hypothetical protein [Accumulibacter sp.]